MHTNYICLLRIAFMQAGGDFKEEGYSSLYSILGLAGTESVVETS